MADESARKSVMGHQSWLRSRYALEDFDYSPSPPAAESDFLHMHIRRDFEKAVEGEKPTSIYDRINQELGLVAETGDRRLSVTKADKKPNLSKSPVPALRITSARIKLATSGSNFDDLVDQKERANQKILDPTVGRDRALGSDDASNLQASCLDPSTHFPVDSNNALGHTRSIRETIENISSLEISPVDSSKPSSTEVSPEIKIPTTESPIQVEAAKLKHPIDKIMDRSISGSSSNVTNFFFTGGFFGTKHWAPNYSASSGTVAQYEADSGNYSHDSSSAYPGGDWSSRELLEQRTKQMEEGDQISASIEEIKTAKKRRPRPSALRDMNIYAPQSM